MTLSGDICLKLSEVPGITKGNVSFVEDPLAFSLRDSKFTHPTALQETVPVTCELILKENAADEYEEVDDDEYEDDGEESA